MICGISRKKRVVLQVLNFVHFRMDSSHVIGSLLELSGRAQKKSEFMCWASGG
jgi:hypothetical protein